MPDATLPMQITDRLLDGLAVAWTCPRCGGTLREWQALDALGFRQTIIAHMQGHSIEDEALGVTGWIDDNDGTFARKRAGRLTVLAGRVTDGRWFWTIVDGRLGRSSKPETVASDWVIGDGDRCKADADAALDGLLRSESAP